MRFTVDFKIETVLRIFDICGVAREYTAMSAGGEGVRTQTLITENGTAVQIIDTVRLQEEGAAVQRRVIVLQAGKGDAGFATELRVRFPFAAETTSASAFTKQYSVFAPGMIYEKNEGVVKTAIGADLNIPEQYFRTTRLALPYVQLYADKTGENMSLYCVAPVPKTGRREYSEAYISDSSLQYPSLGLLTEGVPGLACAFPGREGPVNYVTGQKEMAERSHPVATGAVQEYAVDVHFAKAENSRAALRKEWRCRYAMAAPVIRHCNLKKVYEDGVNVIDSYCREYNGAMGLPFWSTVPEGEICDISFQMGFVGQQPQCAYHLIRSGYKLLKSGDARGEERLQKGRAVIDFWVNRSRGGDVLPHVWYEVSPPEFRKGYPAYTRTLFDGLEGILNAYTETARAGEFHPDWLRFCTDCADWFCTHQNEDGSVYRAYEHDGTPAHTGKYNTTNIIRFLTVLYTLTKKESYRLCALKAGEYCYQHIYSGMHYIGGTADNDNTIDKEAGMLALYAFLALYDLTGAGKWLEAACGAADFAESWTYCWEFPVLPAKGSAVFDRSGITGLSFIATGHSHSDVMMAYCAYDYWRLALLTEDKHYREFATLLLHQARQTTDWSGRLGYARSGLVEESGELARLYHNGLGRWLPWCTIAEIEPLSRLEEFFGTMETEQIDEKAALKALCGREILYSGAHPLQ